MKIKGKVRALLNARLLLIEFDDGYEFENRVGRELAVLADISNAEVSENLGLANLFLPKGKVRIVAPQEGAFAIAERFKEGERVETRSAVPDSGFANLFREVRVGGTWSAKFAASETQNLDFDEEVHVGDAVGEL